MSLAAVWLANRPPTAGRSYGLYRLEMLAATANALLLLGVAAVVAWAAVQRLIAPPEVEPRIVIAVAVFALVGNLLSLRLLARGQAVSLTIRGAYLEVLGDLLGAGAVLVSGVVILLTGFEAADAIASLAIAAADRAAHAAPAR